MQKLTISELTSPLKRAFAISRGAKMDAVTLQVSVETDRAQGRGECVPYARYGETLESVRAQIEGVRAEIEAGCDLDTLQTLLPAGAARCAVDCALWDLKAKTEETPVWQLVGLPEPVTLPTTMTLSLDNPDAMAKAAKATPATILKLKLGGPNDFNRVEAVHAARPDAKLILDGNEGIVPADFPKLVDMAAENGVVLIEQPFPVSADNALLGRPGRVAICADESVHTREDIQALAQKYDAINIKLDKAGGLTEALAMLQEARRSGLGVMVGCMVAGSLSMAPALLLGQAADLIDLDGPLWLKDDIENGLVYKDGSVAPPDTKLWG